MAREYSITPFAMTSADDDDSETQSETGSVDSLYCPPEVVTLDVRPTREQPFCPESDKVNRDLDKIRDIEKCKTPFGKASKLKGFLKKSVELARFPWEKH